MAAAIRSSGSIGEDLVVEADIFKDGHDVVAAALKWRMVGESSWHETPMTTDRQRSLARDLHSLRKRDLEYTVEAWTDTFTRLAARIRREVRSWDR